MEEREEEEVEPKKERRSCFSRRRAPPPDFLEAPELKLLEFEQNPALEQISSGDIVSSALSRSGAY